jgi:hypothetical protein
LKGVDQRRFINALPAGAVHQNGGALHPAEGVGADNSLRLGCERAGQRYEICPREELRKTIEVMDGIGAAVPAMPAPGGFAAERNVAKIVTAWLAMEVLGPDYRFETRFYLDRDRVLYIRGGGDPFLISEELAQLASALVAIIGKQPLSGIVLDASYYPSDIRIPGNALRLSDGRSQLLGPSLPTRQEPRRVSSLEGRERAPPKVTEWEPKRRRRRHCLAKLLLIFGIPEPHSRYVRALDPLIEVVIDNEAVHARRAPLEAPGQCYRTLGAGAFLGT